MTRILARRHRDGDCDRPGTRLERRGLCGRVDWAIEIGNPAGTGAMTLTYDRVKGGKASAKVVVK